MVTKYVLKFRLLRSKRALSPVVAAMFLMAIILAAIALTLGIIYPMVNELNDNIELANAGTSIQSLHDDVKTLISNGEGGIITRPLEIGSTGYIASDLNSNSKLFFMYTINGVNPQILNIFSEPQNRFIISQSVKEGSVPKNSHSYLEGSGNQGLFFLNDSNKAKLPWGILNQSRGSLDLVNTSLSYRGLITPSKVIDAINGIVKLTISIQIVEFDFPGNLVLAGHNPTIKLEYTNLNVTRTAFSVIPDIIGSDLKFYIKIQTLLEGDTTIEYPFSHEVPTDGILYVRLEIIKHHISLIF